MVRGRALGVARLVVGLVVDDAGVGAGGERVGEPAHVQRLVVAVAGEPDQPGATGIVLRVADQVVVEVGVPGGVETEAALVGRLEHRPPAGVVLGDQENVRADQPQRVRPFAQELLAEDVGVRHRTAVGVADLSRWIACVRSTRKPSKWNSSSSVAALEVNIWRTISSQKRGAQPLDPLSI